MSRITLGARILAGAIVSVAAVGAVVTLRTLPIPELTQVAPVIEVTPEAARTLLACDGQILALGRDADDASALTVTNGPGVVTGNSAGDAAESADKPVTGIDGASWPLVWQDPDGTTPVAVAAAGSVTMTDDDLSGFAASTCLPGAMESWIVGGDTTTGSTGILRIANPTQVTATVSISVFGASGEQSAAGGSAIAVPGETEVVLPLAGLVGGEESPVLRITATGAPVRTTLQSSMVRTLTPTGVDLQSAVAADRTQVIGGVTVVDTDSVTGQLRLLSTTAGTATVTITAAGSATPVRDPETVPLEAGVPVAVQLDGLTAGTYAVRVDADDPLVAGVYQATGMGEGSDYAWYPSTQQITGTALAAVPNGPGGAFSFVNSSDADATVTLTAPDGTATDVAVPAGGYVSSPVFGGPGVYTVDVDGAVNAAVTYSGDGALAAIPVIPDSAASTPVTVHP
ncbi:MAG: DUF5719 family protein [Microbacterium sp.]